MKEINVNGQKRTDTGKKASKQLRKEGLVPCNLYGEKKGENGQPEAFAFSASMAELRKAVYTPHVYVVNLNIDGKEHKAITVGIPVNLTGHAQGVRDGGRLSQSIRLLNVTAPYKQIPEKLDIDVTDLQLGKAIKVGSLSFEGLEIATSKEVIVCSVKATRASRSAAAEAVAE